MAIGVPRPLAIEIPRRLYKIYGLRYFGAHGEHQSCQLR